MATILQMLQRVENLNIQQITETSITDTSETISDFNAEQMSRGKESDGSDITPPYTFFTVMEKMRAGVGLGKVTDRVTLFSTGAFYKGIYTSVTGDSVVTTSTDGKTIELIRKYGSDIFGLSAPFKQEYIREVLQDAFRILIRKSLDL